MSTGDFGDTIDIHGGGADLEFPHHTNEIAQSEAKTGKTFANYWMHNGFVNIDNVKMSKSLGTLSPCTMPSRPLMAKCFASSLRPNITASLLTSQKKAVRDARPTSSI